MKNGRRPVEFHYYDGDFNRWFGSQTRAKCRALFGADQFPSGVLANVAENTYRSLLDYRYKGGHIPSDLEEISQLWMRLPISFG